MSDTDLKKHEQLGLETLMSAQIEMLYREIVMLKGLLAEARPFTLSARHDLYDRISKVLGIRR